MKITRSQLRRLINEEFSLLKESNISRQLDSLVQEINNSVQYTFKGVDYDKGPKLEKVDSKSESSGLYVFKCSWPEGEYAKKGQAWWKIIAEKRKLRNFRVDENLSQMDEKKKRSLPRNIRSDLESQNIQDSNFSGEMYLVFSKILMN